jgi:hypothetical protein
MAEGCREGLLKKKNYYENCPGCKVDQYKELRRGLPIRELVSTWIVVLCTGNLSHLHALRFHGYLIATF